MLEDCVQPPQTPPPHFEACHCYVYMATWYTNTPKSWKKWNGLCQGLIVIIIYFKTQSHFHSGYFHSSPAVTAQNFGLQRQEGISTLKDVNLAPSFLQNCRGLECLPPPNHVCSTVELSIGQLHGSPGQRMTCVWICLCACACFLLYLDLSRQGLALPLGEEVPNLTGHYKFRSGSRRSSYSVGVVVVGHRWSCPGLNLQPVMPAELSFRIIILES